MVFDFLKGEFIDVISWLDDTRDTMVARRSSTARS
jgi:hypothetical protein